MKETWDQACARERSLCEKRAGCLAQQGLYKLHLAELGDRPADATDEGESSPLSDFAGSVTATGTDCNSGFAIFETDVSMSQAL